MQKPFRFGVQLSSLPAADWAQRLRRIEALGYASIFWPDHFGTQWEPVAALAAAAAATQRLAVGSLEFSSLSFVVAISDDPKPLREALARSSGMSVEQVADAPLFLTGSASEIRERLLRRREETGISYVVIQGRDEAVPERFAEAVVEPLSGR
jgi:alkanesulfonate monooxygenase SsuD/methylene tetrahydromethanopterin reductase-like flavin-dependent oxidoreductase (luciferase family)